MSDSVTIESIYEATDDIRADPVRVPWRKACAVCVFRRSNPWNINDDTRAELVEQSAWGLDFYCLHQVQSNGCHQPCASAAALFRGDRHGLT